MIRALLFDFDGVVVDIEAATFQSWCDTYAEYGVELALEDWLPAVGSGSSTSGAFDAVAHLERLVGSPVDRDGVIARRSLRKAELSERAPLLPGVSELLDDARRSGSRTAIVTRNSEERVRAQCEIVGLDHPWDALVCADDRPTRDKAELYRAALALLHLGSDEALAFEDSISGLRAAKRAGVRCAAVPNQITRGSDFREADIVLPTLAGVSLSEIVGLVEGA